MPYHQMCRIATLSKLTQLLYAIFIMYELDKVINVQWVYILC